MLVQFKFEKCFHIIPIKKLCQNLKQVILILLKPMYGQNLIYEGLMGIMIFCFI